MRSDIEFDGFEWHESKSDATFAERGIDFVAAAAIFNGPFLEYESRGQDYGETRFVAVGEAEGETLTVVWTPRGQNRRIISTRPASRQERRAYREHRALLERGTSSA